MLYNMADSLQFAFDNQDKLQQRLDAVLKHGEGPWPLPADARKMLELLAWRRGHNRAIKGSELAEFLKTNERGVKLIAKSLTEDFMLPIGASRQEPYGYFLIETAEELESAIGNYANEIRSLARRIRALGGPQRTAELLGQLTLDEQKEKSA